MRKLVLLAGALLVTGGTTVLAENVSEAMYRGEVTDRMEERYSDRSDNEWHGRHFLEEEEGLFPRERMEEHHREMHDFHAELDNFTEEEGEIERSRREDDARRYPHRFFEDYDTITQEETLDTVVVLGDKLT